MTCFLAPAATRQSPRVINCKVCWSGPIPWMHGCHKMGRDQKGEGPQGSSQDIAVRMVRAPNMSADETADILVHCPTWIRDWLCRYDEGGLEGLRDLPRCCRPPVHVPVARGNKAYQQFRRAEDAILGNTPQGPLPDWKHGEDSKVWYIAYLHPDMAQAKTKFLSGNGSRPTDACLNPR